MYIRLIIRISMKNTIRFSILLILQILIHYQINSQCTQTNYTFTSQEEIDNFPSSEPTCTEINGRLSIINSEIINLDSLLQLTKVSSSIAIRGNALLDNLSGLRNIIKCNNLEISNNPNLRDANGIAEIEELDGNIVIANNPRIQFFVGLNKLDHIELAVVTDNDSIFLLNAFNDITNINKSLIIRDNPNLSTLKVCTGTKIIENGSFINLPNLLIFDGLNSLNEIDTLQIINNDKLIQFPRLDSLEKVNGQFIIAENDTLYNLIDFANLHTIEHGLFISDNKNLNSFEGFDKLQTIGENIVIANNNRLKIIEGLNNVDATSPDSLTIINNAELNNCGNQFVCDYIRDESKYHKIENNRIGCNSSIQVLDWCLVDTKTALNKMQINLYPNPVEDILYLDHDSNHPIGSIAIYNSIGHKVIIHDEFEGQISTSALPSGKYFLTIVNHDGISSYSFIK